MPGAGVEHPDAHEAPAPAADHDASGLRERDRVRDEIAQDAFEQDRIGEDVERAWPDGHPDPLLARRGVMIGGDPFQHRLDGEGGEAPFDDAGVEPRDVQKRREQRVHRIDGAVDVFENPFGLGIEIVMAEGTDEHAEGMDRLTKIVTGGCEKARLRDTRFLRLALLFAQVLDEIGILEPQVENVRDALAGAPADGRDGHDIDRVEAEQHGVPPVEMEQGVDQIGQHRRDHEQQERRQEAPEDGGRTGRDGDDDDHDGQFPLDAPGVHQDHRSQSPRQAFAEAGEREPQRPGTPRLDRGGVPVGDAKDDVR